MDTTKHDLSTLFEQLGLSGDSDSIESFLAKHQIEDEVKLADAEFWNTAQRQFLSENLQADADWSEMIDSLDARLRHSD